MTTSCQKQKNPCYMGVHSCSLFLVSTMSPFFATWGRQIVRGWKEGGRREISSPKPLAVLPDSFQFLFTDFFQFYFPTWHPSQTLYPENLANSWNLTNIPLYSHPSQIPEMLAGASQLCFAAKLYWSLTDLFQALWWHTGHRDASAPSPLGITWGHKNDERAGTPLLWGKAERVGLVQPSRGSGEILFEPTST